MSASKPAAASWIDDHFWSLLAGAVALAAAIRLLYVFAARYDKIGGDAFSYHYEALRLADGKGYTSSLGDVGAQIAHHPPGWITLLGVVSWLGGRSIVTHELVTVVVGLGVVVLAGLIGRRYFNPRVGIIAATLAALYPGFWVLEGQILSEPLGLFVLGLLVLAVVDLRERPTLMRSIFIGALCGMLALVRSEHLALLVIVVGPVLFSARSLPLGRRAAFWGVAAFTCVLVISPWTIYNSTRFEKPILLSSNDGSTLLAGNCPPITYSGARLGFYSAACGLRLSVQHPGLDRSQREGINRSAAFHNLRDNADKIPLVVPARFGRLLAVFRPSQTVGYVAHWMRTSDAPIWAWVASFWVLLPLALAGGVIARRSRRFVLPLVAPLIIVVPLVALAYGEPRYHTPADLGVVVLAAVAVDRLVARVFGASEPVAVSA